MIGSPPDFSLPVFKFLPKKQQIRTPRQPALGSDLYCLVDLKGFEPTTSRMRTERSPN